MRINLKKLVDLELHASHSQRGQLECKRIPDISDLQIGQRREVYSVIF